MDRRKAITLLALSATGDSLIPIMLPEEDDSDNINVPDNTAITVIKFKGKTYALGVKIKGDPYKISKEVMHLSRCLENTVNTLTKFSHWIVS